MQDQGAPDRTAFAERYVDLWNERDGAARRSAICSLWSDDAVHVSPSVAVRGYEELEARVSRSNRRWVAEEGCRFLLSAVSAHHNVMRIVWEMIGAGGGVESVGTEVLVFNDDAKIIAAYQFIER